MAWWRRWMDRITGRAERDLDRELRTHLDFEAEEQKEAGHTPDEARYAARRTFGNVTFAKEETRAMWGWASLERLAQDLRYALRMIRKSPGFSTVAIVSLALGIGANTAIFTFVNAALLKPLPYPNADRIVALVEHPSESDVSTFVHPQSFVEWRRRAQSFEALAIAQRIPVNTQGIDGAEEIPGLWATPSLFRVLGVEPLLGRVFTEEEAIGAAASPVASSATIIGSGGLHPTPASWVKPFLWAVSRPR